MLGNATKDPRNHSLQKHSDRSQDPDCFAQYYKQIMSQKIFKKKKLWRSVCHKQVCLLQANQKPLQGNLTSWIIPFNKNILITVLEGINVTKSLCLLNYHLAEVESKQHS